MAVIPSSQAAAERVWSIYDFLHNKRRNRLGHDKVTKLVQLYTNGKRTTKAPDIIKILAGDESDASDDE